MSEQEAADDAEAEAGGESIDESEEGDNIPLAAINDSLAKPYHTLVDCAEALGHVLAFPGREGEEKTIWLVLVTDIKTFSEDYITGQYLVPNRKNQHIGKWKISKKDEKVRVYGDKIADADRPAHALTAHSVLAVVDWASSENSDRSEQMKEWSKTLYMSVEEWEQLMSLHDI